MSKPEVSEIRFFVSFSGQLISGSASSRLHPNSSYIILCRLHTEEDYPDAFSFSNPVSQIRMEDSRMRSDMQGLMHDSTNWDQYFYGECLDLFGRKLLLVSKESNSYLSALISPEFEFALFSCSDVFLDSFDRYLHYYQNSYVGVILQLQQSAQKTKNKFKDTLGCLLCSNCPKTIAFLPCGHLLFCRDCAFQLNMKLNKRLAGTSRTFKCPKCSKGVKMIREIKI